ncbi:MAG TPA: hypothetical protein VF676_13205 [Flavobacterium sp.]|jgi:hypothetical protein
MRNTFILLALLISTCSFAQKIKLKDGIVTVDGVAWIKYTDCGTFDNTCSLLNQNGDELIFFKSIGVEGAEPVSPSNPKGTLSYTEVKFLGHNKSFEIQKSQKNIIQLLYNAKVIDDSGELDEENAGRLVEKYGAEFSARLNAPVSTNTVIIKEAPQRSGVNINLGR